MALGPIRTQVLHQPGAGTGIGPNHPVPPSIMTPMISWAVSVVVAPQSPKAALIKGHLSSSQLCE